MIRDNEEINVFDVERVLGDLPLDLIKENISTQINDPLLYTTNYCDDVYTSFKQADSEFGHIDDYKGELREQRDTFNVFVINLIDSKFNLGIDMDSLEDYAVEDMAKNCYEFFIIRLRNNILDFLMHYIENNKSQLGGMFDDDYKRKDVTTMNMKKVTKNKEDVLLISNLPDIINYVLDLEHDPIDFIDLCSEPQEMVAEYIKEASLSFKIAGSFVSNVLNELKFAHNDIIDEISSDIRLDLMEEILDDTPVSNDIEI